jgi:DNA-binding beta-propeller fold protein YncE
MKKHTYSILSLAVLFLIVATVHSSHSKSKEGYNALTLESSANRVFAVPENGKGIDVIDIKTNTVTNTIFPDKEIKAVAVDEQRKIVAAAEDKDLHILSSDTLQIIKSIAISQGPTSLTIDSKSGLALITHEHGRVSIIDLNAYTVIAGIDVSEKPVSSAVDPNLRLAVVAHQTWGEGNDKSRDNVTIIDLSTFTAIKTLQAGKNPSHVTINPETHLAAVVNEKSNDLTIACPSDQIMIPRI